MNGMIDSAHALAARHQKAFYSSAFGGITTEPGLMCIPMDDHMVHRGHGVFDTAIVSKGCVYQLNHHVRRLLRSAEAARIPLPFSAARMKRIILDTAAHGRTPNGARRPAPCAACCSPPLLPGCPGMPSCLPAHGLVGACLAPGAAKCQRRVGLLRYWLSAGRGGYSLSGYDCIKPEFYCAFYNGPYTPVEPTEGWTVVSSPIPNKPGIFAEIKSNNYLPNVLNLMDAQDRGANQGIFINPDGTICEGPNLNVGIITKEGMIQVPPFKECLAGCTMQRIMELIPHFLASGEEMEYITGIQQARLSCHRRAATNNVMPSHWQSAALR
jgi:4-amino-4-deoxychorismate lyase